MEGRVLDLPINVWDHDRQLSPAYLVTSFPIESADGCYCHECFSQTPNFMVKLYIVEDLNRVISNIQTRPRILFQQGHIVPWCVIPHVVIVY